MIPYQLVSMAAILRDWLSEEDLKYKNKEHEYLTGIADYFYNVGEDPERLLPEYKKLYDEYGPDYFAKVIRDMEALDGQLTNDNKAQELVEDYFDRLDNVNACSVNSSKKVNASRWYYREPMTEEELASLEKDILALPGCDKLDIDADGMEELGQICILPGYEGIQLSDPQYYEKRKQLLRDILRVVKEHGLSRTEDSIEDYGSCWYIVLNTNKPKTDKYDEY